MWDIRKILIGILAGLAMLQFVQFATGFIPLKPLGGVVAEYIWPGFSVQTVKTQQFQEYVSNYSGYKFGFRPLFVRLNNQFYYSLFHKSPYPSLVIGKKGYLYERPYIDSYFGNDFIGDEQIEIAVQKIDTVRSFLQHHGVELVVVITPDKANYFNEYIPDYLKRKKAVSNYDGLKDRLKQEGVHLLDANAWFMEMKGKASYPLVPKTGVHWSTYGSTFFADSLIRYIEGVLGREMYHFTLDSVEYPMEAMGSDRDLEELMNVFTSDHSMMYAYPASFSHRENADGFKPRMLVIGDSFFWNIYQGYLTICFEEITFWYYFNSIFPEMNGKVVTTNEIDIVGQLANKDVVVIITSTASLGNLGFGFVNYIHEFLLMDRHQKYEHLIPRYERTIQNNPELLDMIRGKAVERGIPLDSMIYLDACWLANKHLEDFFPQGDN